MEIPKQPPRERGKTKDRKPASRSKSWKVSEREASRTLQNIDGPNKDFAHVATSTGRVGHITGLQFDSASEHYVIEVKHRATAPVWLEDAWSQILQIAEERRLNALLVLVLPKDTYIHQGRTKKVPTLHCITEERHKRLLEYERRCEELDGER